MIVCRTVGVVSLALLSTTLGLANNLFDYSWIRGFGAESVLREKRASSITAKGALALRRLLDGATPANSKFDNYYRNFHKDGDYVTALNDFYSIKPSRILYIRSPTTGLSALKGRVGDRTVTLYEYNPWIGRPVIHVEDLTAKGSFHGKFKDRIIYVKPKNDKI